MKLKRFINKVAVGTLSVLGLLAFSQTALGDTTGNISTIGGPTTAPPAVLSKTIMPLSANTVGDFEVVAGADGREYTVTDIEATDEMKLVEMKPDEARQKKADAANLDVSSYDDIDFTDVKTIQSALNNEDFPFVDDVIPLYDMDEKALAKSTLDAEEHLEWSSMNEAHFVSSILALTSNINDVPTAYQDLGIAMASARASNVYSAPEKVYDFEYYIRGGTVKPNWQGAVHEWYRDTEFWIHRIDGHIAFCLQPSVTIAAYPTYTHKGYDSDLPVNVYKALAVYDNLWYWTDANYKGEYRKEYLEDLWFAAQIYLWASLKTPIYHTNDAAAFIKETVPYSKRQSSVAWYFQKMKDGVYNMTEITERWGSHSKAVYSGTQASFDFTNNSYDMRVDSVTGANATMSDVSFKDGVLKVNTSSKNVGGRITVTLSRGATAADNTRVPSRVYVSTNSQDLITGSGWRTTKTVTVDVSNPPGNVRINKTDVTSGKVMSGAKFRFSWSGQTLNGITDGSGNTEITGIPDGTVVTMKEIEAPYGYELDSTEFKLTVVGGQTVTAYRTNKLKTGTPQITKKNSATGALLPGAKYKFTWNGSAQTVTTDANGKAVGPTVPHGTVVTMQETEAPYGYELDSSTFTTTIVGGETTNINRTNVPSKGYAQVVKTGDVNGEALQGVTFNLYGSDKATIVKSNLKTDASGKILVSDLLFGTYYFKETAGVSGYAPDGQFYGVTVGPGNKVSSSPASVSVVNKYAQPTISKTVSDMDEKLVTANTWSAKSEDYLQYDLTTSVIARPGSASFSSFVLTDNISGTHVDISDVQVFAGSTNVTAWFTIDKTANVVTATAKSDTLTKADFYGKAYTLRTTMKLKASILSAANKGSFVITKNGTLSFAGTKLKPAAKVSNNVDTRLNAYTITVNHVNEKKTNPPLKVVTEVKYNGESYKYEPFKDLKDTDGSSFKSKTTLTGVVTKDETLTIPYYIPVYEVDVDTIIIDTEKASNGLPVTFKLSERKEYGDELTKIKYRLKVYDTGDGNKEVFSKDLTVASFASEIKGTLKNATWTKDKQVNLKVEVTRPYENPEGNRFLTASDNVPTFGFTASEKVLNNSNIGTTYKKEIQTTKQRTEANVTKKFETLTFHFDPSVTSKTGYGFAVDVDPIYTNELGKTVSLDLGAVVSEPLLLDEDQLKSELVKKGSQYRLPLDVTKTGETVASGVKTTKFKAEMPLMHVDQYTGQLSLSSATWKTPVQVKPERANELRRFYIPIWLESLDDTYKLTVDSTTFGSNYLSFGVDKTINVTAYMYGAQKNETIINDELVVKPIEKVSDIPSDWDAKWVEVVKKWLDNNV